MVAQWMIEPRAPDLTRLEPVSSWDSLQIVERSTVGSWSISGRRQDLATLAQPGYGVVIYRGGSVAMSGDVATIGLGEDDTHTISGYSDFAMFGDPDGKGRVVFPNPSSPWTSQATSAYDVQTGPAETVILHYINANIGASAYAGSGTANDRRVSTLTVPTSLGRGASVRVSARFELLSTLIADLAEAGGLHVDVRHDETAGRHLLVTVRPVVDVSSMVRFGTPDGMVNGLVSGISYTWSAAATDALVAGGGIGTARTQVYGRDLAAQATWGGRVREVFIDEQQSTDATELANAATDALADSSAPVAVAFTITDQEGALYRDDWNIWNRVGVLIYGVDLSGQVREVTTLVQAQEGAQTEQVSAVVGSRDSSAWATVSQKKLKRLEARLAKLEAR